MGPRALLAAVGVAAVFVWLSPTQAQQPASETGAPKAAKSSKTAVKSASPASNAPLNATSAKAVLDRYCIGCHSDQLKTGGLTLQNSDLATTPAHAEQWEKVIRKLRAGSMPPQPMARDQVAIDGLATYLETSIDRAAAANPNPGRPSMHRLNRAEYANAVYDVFGLKVDSDALLPADDESSGFDNIADVLRMSPALMERYLSASWNISREAVGNMAITPATVVYRVRPDLSQDEHIEGLPLGSRGGIRAEHNFPLDGEYTIKVRMWRNTFDLMLGVEDPHDLQIALDGKVLKSVRIGSRDDLGRMAENPGEFGIKLDEQLTVKLPVTAGPHVITTYSVLRSHAELEEVIKPFDRANADSQLITGSPAFDRLSVEGPFQPTGVSETPSRKAIFICHPAKESEELACAKQILNNLGRKAFRRPMTDTDTETLLGFYQRGRNNKSFDAGIESAIQFILASPEFLVRFEPDPDGIAPNTPYRVSDLALASRLSFFLWSTIPDEELLKLAAAKKLHEPAVLKSQMQRMLKDPKAIALTDNFAEQWLFLRNLKNAAPSLESFPDFDDNLRRAMREETRLFFESVLNEDRSVMDLLNADYTFVNERLAAHYGIKGVYGSQFRRVPVTDENRKGILGQASILTVTSYPNRTSPVQRGKWVLTNILGIPPTPPPPNVPALKANEEGGAVKSLRERMELHRENAVCAGCHKVMDPVGFALENFDGIGKWRAKDEGVKIDPSGTMYDGSKVAGPAGLRQMIAKRPEVFVGVMTERLLTYALGRPLRATDMPTVRKIVHDAAKNNYKIDTLIAGVIDSTSFQMRMSSAKGPEGGQ